MASMLGKQRFSVTIILSEKTLDNNLAYITIIVDDAFKFDLPVVTSSVQDHPCDIFIRRSL